MTRSRGDAAREPADRRIPLSAERHGQIKHAASYVLENAATLEDAAAGILQVVCEGMGWEIGVYWARDRLNDTLRFQLAWSTTESATAAYTDASRLLDFPLGVPLPGIAWAERGIVWIPDVARDERFSRRSLAAEAGMRGALAFPILVSGEIIGVMEFLSRDIREPDEALRDVVGSLGVQVSRFLERARAIVELRESESRHRAVLETALDAMIQMDHNGVVREFNPAATEMFGISRDEAVGRELADLIIPPGLRDEHRAGLSRYVSTGEGQIIGSRFETIAMRQDGVEFPVEVSVAPVLAGGPPSFNGFVRDITARKRAEEQARFLNEAGELLSASLDYEQTLASVASLATPYFADWCIVDLVDPAGEVKRIAAAHALPNLEKTLLEMIRSYPPRKGRPHPAVEVVRLGAPSLIEVVDEALWEQIAHDDMHLRMLEALHPRSGLTVPLIARGRVIGAIEFVRAEPAWRFGTADLALGEEVARRAAVAVDNARLYHAAQEALQDREESLALLETVLATAPVGLVFFDREKRVVRINDVLAELSDMPASRHIGRHLHETMPKLAPTLEPVLDAILATGAPVLDLEMSGDLSSQAGDVRHWLASFYPVESLQGEVFGIGGVVTEFTSRRHAEDRLRFLAEASEILANSLDYELTLASVAKLAVPYLADWCIVYLLTEDGSIRRLTTEHYDPAHSTVSILMEQEITIDPHATTGVPHVIRSGASLLLADVTPEDLAADTTDPERLLHVTRPLNLTSWICVPLNVHGVTIGAISFITGEGGRRYTEMDLALAEDVGRRAAVAVENARLFRAEQTTRRFAERVAEQTSRLQAVTSALSRSLTSDEVAGVIVDLGVATLDAQRGMLALLMDDGTTLKIARAVGYPDELSATWSNLPLEISTPPTDAIRSCAPLFLESRAERAERYPHRDRERSMIGGGAVAAIPLMIGDRALGAMTLGFEDDRHFDGSDRAFLMALARQCAQALERARLYGEEQRNRAEAERSRELAARQAARQRLVSEASRSFAEASLDLGQVVGTVVRHIAGTLDGYAGVYLAGETQGSFTRVAAHHADPATLAAIGALIDAAVQRQKDNPVRDVLAHRSLLAIDARPDALRARMFGADGRVDAERLDLHSVMAAPLSTHGAKIGMIVTARHGPAPPYTADDQDLLNDLTSRAALAIENARLYREAQDAIQVREQFLSIASHELRTPLTTVKASAQLLERRFRRGDAEPSRTLALIAQLQDEVGRLETLVADLLDATQIQRGWLELNPERVDLTALARRSLERFDQPMHRSEHHTLRFEADGPVEGSWDASRLDQVITNLISNAVKYSPKGGEVLVTVRRNGESAEIEIKDEGIGISREEQAQLFQPFARGVEARRSVGGTGLGLFISREIIERHGGAIAVYSEPGAGSAFTIRLPIKPDLPEETAS
ncbi:MAG TPA: GAF domain-containing protein [Thermomicrobiales bacterium]|nr:GAF domain-containing protein [Thermomicrobiales bacterium]